MRLPLAIIPDKIIKKYNLMALEKYGWVYIEIQKGMYGLPQLGGPAHFKVNFGK